MKTRIVAACAVLVSASACAPEVRLDEGAFRRASPRTVAVLPFTFQGGEPAERTALKVAALRHAFQRRFASTGYLHLETDVVDRLLRRAGLDDPVKVAHATAEQLGAILDVDAVVRGDIDSIFNVQGGVAFHQAIEGEVRLVDARHGFQLVRLSHRETDTGGLLLGSGQSIEALEKTIENSSDLGFLRLADKWCESVVRALPPPPTAPPVVQPVIDRVELVSLGAVAGDLVEVALTAGPGLEASMDLGREQAEVPLFEETPGHYRGFYRVASGDKTSGPISVHVSDRFGVSASRILRETPFMLDARAPAAPREVRRAATPAGLHVTWRPSESGAAKYRVFGVGADLSPVVLAEVDGLEATVQPPGAAVFVAAADARGRLSSLALAEEKAP
jgi:hypothetical protein